MPTVQVPYHGTIEIPGWVTSLDAFRKWVHSGVLPEKLTVHFLRGDVWVDFNMEEAFTHNLVKSAVIVALRGWARETKAGLAFTDGMLLTNNEAGIGTEPDAMFLSYAALKAKRVAFTAGETTDGDATEIVGSPDIVVEVVSPSSEDKDLEWLMTAYFDAGVAEYWVIDARPDPVRFDIYKRTSKGFAPVRRQAGWLKSSVMERSVRVRREKNGLGFPHYDFDVR